MADRWKINRQHFVMIFIFEWQILRPSAKDTVTALQSQIVAEKLVLQVSVSAKGI